MSKNLRKLFEEIPKIIPQETKIDAENVKILKFHVLRISKKLSFQSELFNGKKALSSSQTVDRGFVFMIVLFFIPKINKIIADRTKLGILFVGLISWGILHFFNYIKVNNFVFDKIKIFLIFQSKPLKNHKNSCNILLPCNHVCKFGSARRKPKI